MLPLLLPLLLPMASAVRGGRRLGRMDGCAVVTATTMVCCRAAAAVATGGAFSSACKAVHGDDNDDDDDDGGCDGSWATLSNTKTAPGHNDSKNAAIEKRRAGKRTRAACQCQQEDCGNQEAHPQRMCEGLTSVGVHKFRRRGGPSPQPQLRRDPRDGGA